MIDGKKVPQSSEVELSGCSTTRVPVQAGSGVFFSDCNPTPLNYKGPFSRRLKPPFNNEKSLKKECEHGR